MQVEIPYLPRKHQLLVHKSLKRFNVLICHRRFGKTVLCLNQLITEALQNTKKDPRYAYISPFYRQSKTVAWDYLKHYTRVIPGMKYNETELRADFPNGARITLYGGDNPDTLRGIYLDGVVLDEFAQMSPRVWSEVIRPALADRTGFAIFIGTPLGKTNGLYELYKSSQGDPEWYSAIYPASKTQVISQAELQSARGMMTEDQYQQEFECSFDASIIGAYYSEQIREAKEQKRICRVPYESKLPVYTSWDLGIGDTTPIIFYQLYGKEIRIIDAEEHSGEGLAFYADLIDKKNFRYQMHNWPHDGDVRELGTGKSRLETARLLGINPIRIIPAQNIDDGIQAVRTIFPRLWIDEKLTGFIDAISQYRKEYDEDKKTFRDRPLHDWSSHYADALRYLSQSLPAELIVKKTKEKLNIIRRSGIMR